MVREAEQHAGEDKRRRELVEARNQADAMIHTAEKQLQEHGARVGDAERRPVEDAVAALREAVSGDNTAGIQQRLEALGRALTRFGEAIQRAAAAPPEDQAASGGQASVGDDDVVDAEFEEVDRRRRG
jgi:molecular chaperone DnaK